MANLIYHGLKSNLPSNREPNSFYLTTDTRELYFGAELYTEPVRFYAGTKPQSPAQGVLYINETTGAGDVYTGTAWQNVIKPTVTQLDASATNEQIPTAKAVKDYIDNVVTGGIGSLGALAEKDEVSEAELSEDLKLKVNTDAEQASKLTGDDANKSVRAIAAEEVAKIVAGADESFDTLKEVADWISSHTNDASAMNSAIKALQNIVKGIGGEGESPTVVAYINDAIKALKIGDYAKAADLAAAVAHIATLEGQMATLNGGADVAGSVAKALADAKAYTEDKATKAETNSKSYADNLNNSMNTRLTAVETAITVGTF